jgi:hypothetical protein
MAKNIEEFAHLDYLSNLCDYQQIRDCFKGERAIKKEGPKYLPMLTGQALPDYNNYKQRALFFPITGKTCSSMVGLAIAKPPKVDYPADMQRYFKDEESGFQFTESVTSTFTEVVLMGRFGVLIDAPLDEGDPVLAQYVAENVVNWEVNERGVPTMVMLREYYLEPVDRFKKVMKTRYRRCELVGGVYVVEVLDDELQRISIKAPTFAGRTINFVPFVPFGSSGVHMDVDKPPMLDISTINLSHYLSSADLEWGRHLVGLPTPIVSGVDAGTKLFIGGTAAWVLPPAEAKAYYLEFQGQGLESLEKAMTDKVSLMASISARLIDNSTRGSEAAETVRLRYLSESATLVQIISAVEAGMVMMYNMLATLMKASGTVSLKFNREILGLGITFKDLDVMFKAYLTGSISKETLVYNLRRLEAIDPNRTDEEELGAIKEPPPPAPKPAATAKT